MRILKWYYRTDADGVEDKGRIVLTVLYGTILADYFNGGEKYPILRVGDSIITPGDEEGCLGILEARDEEVEVLDRAEYKIGDLRKVTLHDFLEEVLS